jgi:hypothetical protein
MQYKCRDQCETRCCNIININIIFTTACYSTFNSDTQTADQQLLIH